MAERGPVKAWVVSSNLTASSLVLRGVAKKKIARWSSGPGRLPFKEEIAGSNPVRVTKRVLLRAKRVSKTDELESNCIRILSSPGSAILVKIEGALSELALKWDQVINPVRVTKN